MRLPVEVRKLAEQYRQGKTLKQLGMKSKKVALQTLREAMVEYQEILEVIGNPTGGLDGELYDDRITAPVCDFLYGDELWEISIVLLDIAERQRTPETNQVIARWKRCEEGA